MPKPVFNLPVSVPGQTTKQALDKEVNRVTDFLFGVANPEDRERAEDAADRADAAALVSIIQAGFSSVSAAEALSSKQVSVSAAIAADPTVVPALPSPTPADGTTVKLSEDAGIRFYTVVAGAWVPGNWLIGPKFATEQQFMNSTASTLGVPGQIVDYGRHAGVVVDEANPIAYDNPNGYHVINAGGVRLWVFPGEKGYDVLAFGAKRDGVTNDQPAVLRALLAASQNGDWCYAPRGEYLMDFDGEQVMFTGEAGTGVTKSFGFHGDGRATVFKRGDGIVTSSFRKIFHFGNAAGSSVAITVREMAIDGNARGNGIPYPMSGVSGTFLPGEKVTNGSFEFTVIKVEGTTIFIYETSYTDSPDVFVGLAPGDTITGTTSGATATIGSVPANHAYIYQQSACLAFSPTGNLGFSCVDVQNVHIIDATADGVSIGGSATNTVKHISLQNITNDIRKRMRSDITITACFDTMQVSGCAVDKFEMELNGHTTALRHWTTIDGLITRVWFDATHSGTIGLNRNQRPVVNASGVIADGFLQLGGANFTFNSPVFRLDCSPRLYDGRYEFHGGSSRFGINGANFTPTKGWFSDGPATPEKILFGMHEFSCDPAATTLAEYFSDLSAHKQNAEVTEFLYCKFLGSAVRSAFLRSGKFRFVGCEHERAGAAILYDDVSASGVTNRLELFENLVTNVDGLLLAAPAGGNQIDIYMRGNRHRHQKSLLSFNGARVMAPRGGGTVLNFVEVDSYQMPATPTTGLFLKGQTVYFTAPDAGASRGVQATVTATAASAGFRSIGSLAL